MVKLHKKFAFSVAEAIVSMLIITIAVIGAAPILTKQKPGAGTNQTYVKGTYACFWDCDETNTICKLKQATCHERTCKEPEDVAENENCKFTQSKRAERLILIASGAGSDFHAGQIKTDLLQSSNSIIEITPGRYDFSLNKKDNFDNGKTKIGSNMEILAGPYYDNGLQPENLDRSTSCRLVSAPLECPETCQEFLNSSPKPLGCSIVENKDKNIAVKIDGCGCKSDTTYHYEDFDKNTFLLSDLKRSPSFLDRLNTSSVEYLQKSMDSNTYYIGDFKFKFMLNDSNYDTRLTPALYKDKSHMSDILQNMIMLRKNILINNIINLKPGAPERNGAVVIIW